MKLQQKWSKQAEKQGSPTIIKFAQKYGRQGNGQKNGNQQCLLPKKGDIQLCSNHRTISLISHPGKIMLKIIMKRLENILETEVNKTQAGFRKGRGTRDHIFNLRNIIEKFREIDEYLHICFIAYSKAFDCVIHKHLWKTLRDMGVHNNIVKLIVNLYVRLVFRQQRC